MTKPAFTVPRVLGSTHLRDVHPDSEVGSINTLRWPNGADVASVSRLLGGWSGLMRGLTLAGYRSVEIFIEAAPMSATERLLLDVASLGLGLTDVVVDELGEARSAGAPLMVALTLDPLWPFGEECGAPLALELPLAVLSGIDGVFAPVHQGSRGWLAFLCDEDAFAEAVGSLRARGEEVAGVLADVVAEAWLVEPRAVGPPAGLGWLFETRDWWFPSLDPGGPDGDARVLLDGLGAVSQALAVEDLGIVEFVTEQVVRTHDPWAWRGAGSFGRLTRTWSGQSPDAVIEAYGHRLEALAPSRVEAVKRTSAVLDTSFTWTDAVMALVDQGAIGVLHRLLPGHPSTALATGAIGVTLPEWTDPSLTGQWDATHSTDTIILNQAGTAVAGFWQQRSNGAITRSVLSGSLTAGDRDGGSLELTMSAWPKPAGDVWLHNEDELGPPVATGTAAVEQPPGSPPRLSLSPDLGGGMTSSEFVRSSRGAYAHHTPWTLVDLPAPVKDQIYALRDAPLHGSELSAVEWLTGRVVHYVNRFIEEEPNRTALASMMSEFELEVSNDAVLRDLILDFDDLLATARTVVRDELVQQRPVGGDSHWTLLIMMFRFTATTSVWLQDLFDLRVLPEDGATYRYRWRLFNIHMIGLGYGVGVAEGTGTFELQRVDDDGDPVGEGEVFSRTIDLRSFEAGLVYYTIFGPDDMKDWNYLDPTNRDVVPHLDGASFSLTGAGLGLVIIDSSSSVKVTLVPTDGLGPVEGWVAADLVKVPSLDPSEEDLDPDEVYSRIKRSKAIIEAGRDLLKKGLKKGMKGKPDAKIATTTGWIRNADDTASRYEPTPTPADDYVSPHKPWVSFATNKYELTPEFRDRIRSFALWNLPLLTGINELVVEGNASQIGSNDYNVRLSRDRATSVLTAMYDILGPQFAIPCGSVLVRGLGNSQSTGDPDSDLKLDRRVDLVLGGRVRLRS